MPYNLTLPPVVLPHDLTRQTESLRDLVARLRPDSDDDTPDLIVLLLRAAPIPFAAVEACAEANGVALPPVISAHIGSELYVRYEWEKAPNLYLPFSMLGPEERVVFRTWLDDDPNAQQVATYMKQDAAAAGVTEPRRILIYDDFEGHGGTLYAARHLIGHAFPDATTETSIAWFRLDELARGPRIRLRINDRPLASVEQFLCDLLTGYREGPDGLHRLDSPEQLRLLGQQCKTHRDPDPYPLLAEIYGDERLIGFSEHVRTAFREWGHNINL